MCRGIVRKISQNFNLEERNDKIWLFTLSTNHSKEIMVKWQCYIIFFKFISLYKSILKWKRGNFYYILNFWWSHMGNAGSILETFSLFLFYNILFLSSNILSTKMDTSNNKLHIFFKKCNNKQIYLMNLNLLNSYINLNLI